MAMTKTIVDALLRRDRAIVIAALTAISVLAWAYVLWLVAQMTMMEMPMPAVGCSGIAGTNMPGMTMPGDSGAMDGMNIGGSMSAVAEPAFRSWSFADFGSVVL